MAEYINTYEACSVHKNGHSGHCEKCETENVRGLLREVVNSEMMEPDEFGNITLFVKPELWGKIVVLRTVPVPVRTAYEMTDAATATGMYDHDTE